MTGMDELDEMLGPIVPGMSILLGAETSWGKSTLAVAIADENRRAGRTAVIVSFEDVDQLYGDRLLARRAAVNALRLRDRKLRDYEMARVARVVSEAESAPILMNAIGRTAECVARDIKLAAEERSVDLWIFDYIQAVGIERPYQDRRNELREAAAVLRTTCRATGSASILLSQLTKEDPRDDHPPTRDMIRDCRDLSNSADVVLLGWQPQTRKAITELEERTNRSLCADPGDRLLIVDKNKNGPRGAMRLHWDPESASFRCIDVDAAWSRAEADAADLGYADHRAGTD